jgi:hypothetical protein
MSLGWAGDKMKDGYRYLGLLFLTAALIAPLGIVTATVPQGEKQQGDNRTKEKKPRRVYDHTHKDYHIWDENEERSYRQYLSAQHQDFRDYSKLKRKQQNDYWNWRHNQPPFVE